MTLRLKRIVSGVILMLSLLVLGACQRDSAKVVIPKKPASDFVVPSKFNQDTEKSKRLADFVSAKMVTNKGIYTNYRTGSATGDLAHGHQMLSESSGLWLTYLARTHQYQAFRRFYQQTKKTFNQKNQFSYRYDPKTKKLADVNATLDDLRVIRALELYATLTKSHKYRYEAAKRFALLKTGSLKNGNLANFYDVKAHKQSKDSSLAYYDLLTLRYFESTNKAGKKLFQKQLSIVKQGYLGDAFPLYAASYRFKTKSYANQNLNTSEALETVLHLAEIHQVKSETLTWLANQVKQKKLYNGYTTLGIVVDEGQSAANYALAAMIFACQGNKQLYQQAMKLVWQNQVVDSNSPIYGGLGDAKTHDSYSFNNLVALVATEY